MHEDAFHYIIGPTTGSRWRPRAVIQGRQTAEEHSAAVAAKCAAAGVTVTAEQVAAVITASDQETLVQARRTFAVNYPGGLTRMLPTAGSSHPTPEFEGTVENLDPGAARSLTRAGHLYLAQGFTSHSEGVVAEKGATMTRVVNLANGAEDQYKVNKGQLVEGADLAGVGVEFPGSAILYVAVEGGATTAVPFDSIVQRTPSRLSWIVPEMTGPQMLKLIVFLNGGLRTTIYDQTLSAIP